MVDTVQQPHGLLTVGVSTNTIGKFTHGIPTTRDPFRKPASLLSRGALVKVGQKQQKGPLSAVSMVALVVSVSPRPSPSWGRERERVLSVSPGVLVLCLLPILVSHFVLLPAPQTERPLSPPTAGGERIAAPFTSPQGGPMPLPRDPRGDMGRDANSRDQGGGTRPQEGGPLG